MLAPYLDADGILDSRTAGLKSSIDVINERREALNVRLAALQARYTKQFNALDSLLAQLQSTSNFLTQQLGNLPLIPSATELRFHRLWSYRHLAERQRSGENFDENRFHSRPDPHCSACCQGFRHPNVPRMRRFL